jgi:hypothetical protein
MVKVGLKRGRHAKIVHGQPQYDHIRGLKLVNLGIRVSHDRVLVVGALLWSRKESLKAVGRQVRSRIAGEIASDDLCSEISLAPEGRTLVH